jgi:hypothetical protein
VSVCDRAGGRAIGGTAFGGPHPGGGVSLSSPPPPSAEPTFRIVHRIGVSQNTAKSEVGDTRDTSAKHFTLLCVCQSSGPKTAKETITMALPIYIPSSPPLPDRD